MKPAPFTPSAAVALLFAATPAASTEGDPAFGHWLVESGRAIVELGPCGESACAEVVWLAEPFGEDGAPVKDVNNEIPELRDREVCGLSLMSGFEREAPGEWEDGEIYNGEDGKTYSAEFELQPDGTLKVRGYVGISAFGKTQTWTRAEGDRGGCRG